MEYQTTTNPPSTQQSQVIKPGEPLTPEALQAFVEYFTILQHIDQYNPRKEKPYEK